MWSKGAFGAAFCAFCVSVGFAGEVVELKNAGFEETGKNKYPVGWSRHPDWHGERAGHNGSGGLVFECSEGKKQKRGRPQQEVFLKAGRRYYVSVLVKTTDIVTERKTPAQGVGIYLDCYGADGKWKFGGSPRVFVNGTSEDWTKVEFITREVPDGIARAYIQPWAKSCVSGRAVVDNVYIAEYDIPPVEGVFSHVYRNESAGGLVRFSASINTDVRKHSLKDYSAAFTYTAADGSRKTVSGAMVSPVEAAVELDTSLFALGTNDVTCALSLGGKMLGESSVRFARVETLTRRRVYIDEYKRAIVDGKPFFPLGMYFKNSLVSASNLAVYTEGPFNCVMPYAKKGLSPSDLELYRQAGLKVIFDLRYGLSDESVGKPWVHEMVRKFRGHPSLLAWYTNDERPVADIPKLAARQKWVEALDPDHPTWSVQDVFSEVRHYLGTYDVLGMDPYPIPKKPIERVISSMRQGVSGTFGTKAVWQVPQAFGWGWLKRRETKGQRAPTQKELSNMTWQSIAGGANGIVYYAFHHLSEPHEDPNDAFEPAWARTKAAAAEVKKYEQVMLSVERPVTVSGATESVAVRTWRHEKDTYLLVVNCTTNAQTARLTLSEDAGRLVSSDFGPAPKIEGRTVEASLEPIGYRMLRLK